MKEPKTIVVVDDNPDFGGHQVMTCHGMKALLSSEEFVIHAMLHPLNQRNQEAWKELSASFKDTLILHNAPTRTEKFQGLRNYLFSGERKKLLAEINRIDPDLVLAIQGNIEHSSSVLWLSGQLSCPLLSYIPLPHTHAEMGAKMGWVRDLFCKSLYRKPDGYVIISPTLAKMLEKRGASGKIEIVENGIPLEHLAKTPTREEARIELDLPRNAVIWGHVGRIEFKQKGQDFSLQCFDRFQKDHPEKSSMLLFAGSGPDENELKQMISGRSDVRLLPWRNDLRAVYAAMDGLLLPSRYEGVPLVMLEALAVGCPVAGTDRDGMCDWLPPDWRFHYRNQASALTAMAHLCDNPEKIRALRDRVWSNHSLISFQNSFLRTIKDWTDNSKQAPAKT